MAAFRWDRLSAEQASVLRALLPHRGALQAVPVPEVASRVELAERRCQDVVKSLIEDFGIPIGTSRSSQRPGWYLCETPAELEYNHRALAEQGRSILRRAAAFNAKNHQRLAQVFYGQMPLPLTLGKKP